MKPRITWILVADASRASIFANDGPGKGLRHVPGEDRSNDVKSSREINADRPGRSFDSKGKGRHAMEPPTDPKQHAINEFARSLALALKSAFDEHRFERLVLVTPPSFLGELRKDLPKDVQNCVIGEIQRDLVHASVDEIAGHLSDVLAA